MNPTITLDPNYTHGLALSSFSVEVQPCPLQNPSIVQSEENLSTPQSPLILNYFEEDVLVEKLLEKKILTEEQRFNPTFIQNHFVPCFTLKQENCIENFLEQSLTLRTSNRGEYIFHLDLLMRYIDTEVALIGIEIEKIRLSGGGLYKLLFNMSYLHETFNSLESDGVSFCSDERMEEAFNQGNEFLFEMELYSKGDHGITILRNSVAHFLKERHFDCSLPIEKNEEEHGFYFFSFNLKNQEGGSVRIKVIERAERKVRGEKNPLVLDLVDPKPQGLTRSYRLSSSHGSPLVPLLSKVCNISLGAPLAVRTPEAWFDLMHDYVKGSRCINNFHESKLTEAYNKEIYGEKKNLY